MSMETSARNLRVAVGTDHAGFVLKPVVIDEARRLGAHIADYGASIYDEHDDYPDVSIAVARAVAGGQADRGVLLCGSGVGVVLAANRVPGVRACLCHDTFSAGQGVHDDNMNVLCLGARVIGAELARQVVAAFLRARFAAGVDRYVRRLNKIRALERDSG